MERNSHQCDIEGDTMFDDSASEKNIKLFDVFDDPPHIDDSEKSPLEMSDSDQHVSEDDDSFGYDSVFQSKIEQSKCTSSQFYAGEGEKTLSCEPQANDIFHNGNKSFERQKLIEEHTIDGDDYKSDVDNDEYHREIMFNDKEVGHFVDEKSEKSGRWPFSGGAAKKPRPATTSNTKKPATVYEKEKFAIHSESQRLIREANFDLLYYKPKEYTTVAEFKKALHGDKSSLLSTLRPLGTRKIVASQNAVPSSSNGALSASSPSPTERIVFGTNFKLPEVLPPPQLLKANDDDIIDLLQDDQPVIPCKRSEAQKLPSAIHKFAESTDSKDSAQFPKIQKLSILAKVSDAKTGRVALKMGSVDYKSSNKKTLIFTNRREWENHREELKRIMRAKKLKQYEERQKNYKPSRYLGDNASKNDSDEDENWLEEDDMSCSSSSSSESAISDDESENDVETPLFSKIHRKVNPFIDDEAVEDDNSEDENLDDENASEKDKFLSDNHSPSIPPIHNHHLEPGDVDLFASDSITQTVQGDKVSASLLDRSWNATPFSLLYSQKRLPSNDYTTDSLSLEQTKLESIMPIPSKTLIAAEPTQPIAFQGGLDDNSVVKVELNFTQIGGPNRPTEGPTQTQFIDDFEDIYPNHPLTTPSSPVKELSKPKLVRVRDSSGFKTLNNSNFLHSSTESTQSIPSFAVRYTSFADLDLAQNVGSNPTQTVLFENAPSTVPLSNEPSAGEISRPKLLRIRDVCTTSTSNESSSLPDNQELCLEADRLSQPKLDLLDPSYIQCSYATQAMADPPATPAIDGHHKPRKRLRHNSDDESTNEALDFETSFKRRATVASNEPIGTVGDTTSLVDDDFDAISLATKNDDEDIDNVEDFDDGVAIEEEAEEVEEYSSDEDEERQYLKQIRETQLSTKDLKKKHPKFRPSDFIEEEAELSGDEAELALYGDGQDEEVDDEDDAQSLKDFVDESEMDDRSGKLRREVERIYNRIQEDADQRKLRYLKEIFFEDGDLYDEEGRERRRRFRWKGLDDEDPLMIKRVDLDLEGAGDEQEESEIPICVGQAGFMSRGLLREVSVKEIPSPSGVKDVAADGSRNENVPVTENSSNEAAAETQITMESSEGIISALGRKVIFFQRSCSVAPKSPNVRAALDPLQRTLPGMLYKSSPTSDLTQPGRRVTVKRGSLLSHPSTIVSGPARSRSLISTSSLSQKFSSVNMEVEMDNDAENDYGTANRCQVGLRTKIGLSCFSARKNGDIPPTINRSNFFKPADAQSTKVTISSNSVLKNVQSDKSSGRLSSKSIFKSLK